MRRTRKDGSAYSAVDRKRERGEVEANNDVNGDVCATGDSRARYGGGHKRVEISLDERRGRSGRVRSGVGVVRTHVAQNRGVNPVVEPRRTAIGHSTDPVVVDRLVGR